MSDVTLARQIERQERKILGAQDWIDRARKQQIKRPIEAVEKAAADLVADNAILGTLRWLDKNYDTVKAAVAKKGGA